MEVKKKINNGVDRLIEFKDEYLMDRVGLLTTGASMDRHLNSTLAVINNHMDLTSLFGAEFGVLGEKASGERYESYKDIWTGLTVFSLYRYGSFHFTHEMLASFDTLFVDLPLTGLRYDSYIETLHRLLRQLGNTDKKVVILDRPNPLGGELVQGPVIEADYMSDDEFPLPIRYGMTIGELAIMMNTVNNLHCNLQVIELRNWERKDVFDDTDVLWNMPRLEYPNLDGLILASGLHLLEGTNVSFGEGTSLPFQVIAAPFLDGVQLAANLNKALISGIRFTPIYFTPTKGMYQGTKVQGVRIHVTQRKKIKPIDMAIAIIAELKRIVDKDLLFVPAENDQYLKIDKMFGNSKLSRQHANSQELIRETKREADAFREKSKEFYLYE